MNSRWFALLAFLIISSMTPANGQPWSIMEKGRVYYFEQDTNGVVQGHFISKVDTVQNQLTYVCNPWQYHLGQKDYHYFYGSRNYPFTRYDYSFSGPESMESGNADFLTSYKWTTSGAVMNDSIFLQMNWQLNDTWPTKGMNDTARVTALSTVAVGNVTDSFVWIETAQWALKLSKEHGVLEFKNKAEGISFVQVGIQDEYGYQRPSWRELVPYFPNDSIETVYESFTNVWGGATSYLRTIVTNRQEYPDSIVLTCLIRKRTGGNWRTDPSQNKTTVKTYTEHIRYDSLHLQPIVLGNQLIEINGIPHFRVLEEMEKDHFITYADKKSFEAWDGEAAYKQYRLGVGMLFDIDSRSYGQDGKYSEEALTAYHIGTQDSGTFVADSFYTLSSDRKEEPLVPWSIYPNPGTFFHMQFGEHASTQASLLLVDLHGRVVWSKDVSGLNAVDTDLSHLSNGLYTAILKTESGRERRPLVIVH